MKIMDKFVQCYTFGDIFKKSYLFLNSEARVAKQNERKTPGYVVCFIEFNMFFKLNDSLTICESSCDGEWLQ